MKKRTIMYIGIAAVLIGIIGTTVYYYKPFETAQTNQQEVLGETTNQGITYKGKNGVSALSLLKQNAKIETSGTGEMTFVTTINDITADPNSEYWQLNVNDKSASVGAGSYITTDAETISWKLVKF